jgi:hypothetical protein
VESGITSLDSVAAVERILGEIVHLGFGRGVAAETDHPDQAH